MSTSGEFCSNIESNAFLLQNNWKINKYEKLDKNNHSSTTIKNNYSSTIITQSQSIYFIVFTVGCFFLKVDRIFFL